MTQRSPRSRRGTAPAFLLAFAAALAVAVAFPHPAAGKMPPGQVEPDSPADLAVDPDAASALDASLTQEGIAVQVNVDPLEGEKLQEGGFARVRITVRDDNTGTPLSALYPAAWLDRIPQDQQVDEGDACKSKVQQFVGGSLLSQAEIDLNVFYVLALNEDPSISVVDPLFGFGGSKLLAMIHLEAPGVDWALTEDQQRLFVALPSRDRVAVAETLGWKVVTHTDVGPGPQRLALQPDGAFLWVVFDGEDKEGAHHSGVSVVHTGSLKEVARLDAGTGARDLAFSDDGRFAYVASSEAGTVSVYDTARQARVAEIATGPHPESIAWSATARALFVADAVDGSITTVGGDDAPRKLARMEAAPGLTQIKVTPDGRYALAVSPAANTLYVVDTAANRIVQSGEMEGGPDQVGFTDELAYVSHRGSETVITVPLASLGDEGQPIQVIDFPGGALPPGTDSAVVASAMAQAPGAPAMLLANPRDGVIYYYKEGMAAPMGHFKNYGRRPLAVQVVDRSLQEIEPGVYETGIRLRRPGHYEMAFFLDTPRIVHCFDLQVAADPELQAARRPKVAVQPLTRPHTLTVGEPVELRFKVSETDHGEPVTGLSDFQVLTVLAPGIWHQRQEAVEEGDGVYRLTFTPHRRGVYYVYAGTYGGDGAFYRNPYQSFRAVEAETETASATAAETASRDAGTPSDRQLD